MSLCTHNLLKEIIGKTITSATCLDSRLVSFHFNDGTAIAVAASTGTETLQIFGNADLLSQPRVMRLVNANNYDDYKDVCQTHAEQGWHVTQAVYDVEAGQYYAYLRNKEEERDDLVAD